MMAVSAPEPEVTQEEDGSSSSSGAAATSPFAAECEAAMAGKTAVLLPVGATIALGDVVHVRRGALTIEGHASAPATLVGSGHCLFQVQGRAKLQLRHVVLQHVCTPLPAGTRTEKVSGTGVVTVRTVSADDVSTVGAAIFLLNKASCSLESCSVSSSHGMGVWSVQRAKCELHRCHIGPVARSGVALFGQSRVTVADSSISSCGIHGVCARGTATLVLTGCTIEACERRGAYGYQRASLTMERCSVRRIADPTRAALEAAGCREGDAVTLSLRRCKVRENSGAGIRVRGAVKVIADEELALCSGDNKGPDVDVSEASVDAVSIIAPWPEPAQATTTKR